MNNFYIYQYVRAKASKYGPVGSPYYIGKGRAKRAWRLGGRSVQRPLNKDQVVIVAEMLSETEAFTMETSLILTHGRIDLGTGYLRNRTNGGEGNSGRVISEETRRKMSIAKKGKKLKPETCRKMSESRKGRRLTESWRRNIGNGNKGVSRRRPPHSIETRNKISVSVKRSWEEGRRWS